MARREFVVTLGYQDYIFNDADEAMQFACTAKNKAKDEKDVTITIEDYDEEETKEKCK